MGDMVRLQNSKKGHEVVFEGEGEFQVEKESSRDPRAKPARGKSQMLGSGG